MHNERQAWGSSKPNVSSSTASIGVTNSDYKNGSGLYDLAMFDPPFDIWKDINWKPNAKTYCCFTNFQNRHHVEKMFGVPKFEMIWFFSW